MAARLLFVGDIHLGRRPSRLPEDLEDLGLRGADFTPAAAWRASVDLAIERGVDAVVFAGDVVDAADDRFEAYRHLQAGVGRLAEAGIGVFGVAGNHDVEVLPRLAEQIPRFRLLGAAGNWESTRVESRSGPDLHLLGWSFPARVMDENPLESLQFEPESGSACLGVLHCDLDGGRSRYAPVPRAALEGVGVDGWLLGHIHRPDALTGHRPIGYLGSLVGLDPGESGAHGPWLLEVDGPGRVKATQWPLAPLRWERYELALSELDEAARKNHLEDALAGELQAVLAAIHRRIGEQLAADPIAAERLRLVGCRIRLSGRGRHYADVRRLLAARETWPSTEFEGTRYFIEKIEERAAPDLDLEELARAGDPPAVLARELLALMRRDSAAENRVRQLADELDTELGRPPWSALDDFGAPPDAARVRELLLRAGTRMLETLLAQRSDPSEPPRDSEVSP